MSQGHGEVQSESVTRLRAARQQWAQVENLRRAYRHEEALPIVASLAADTHPAAAAIQEGAAKLQDALRTEWLTLQSQRNERLRSARTQFDQKHDREVIRELELIPEAMWTQAVKDLLTAARSREAEVQKLLQEIRAGTMTHRYQGLLAKAARLKTLRPEDLAIQRMYAEILERGTGGSAAAETEPQPVDDRDPTEETGTELWVKRLNERDRRRPASRSRVVPIALTAAIAIAVIVPLGVWWAMSDNRVMPPAIAPPPEPEFPQGIGYGPSRKAKARSPTSVTSSKTPSAAPSQRIAAPSRTSTVAPSGRMGGYWTFDEADGPQLTDSSGQGNHGRLGAPTSVAGELHNTEPLTQRVPGKFGKALRIQRAAAVLDTAGDFEAGDPFSVGLWVRRDGNQGKVALLSKLDPDPPHTGWELCDIDGRLLVTLCNVWRGTAKGSAILEVSAETPLSAGEWHHVAFTYDGSKNPAGLQVYLDGQPARTATTQNSLNGSIRTATPLWLGSRTSQLQFAGALDELAIFDRKLSADEIQSLMSGG